MGTKLRHKEKNTSNKYADDNQWGLGESSLKLVEKTKSEYKSDDNNTHLPQAETKNNSIFIFYLNRDFILHIHILPYFSAKYKPYMLTKYYIIHNNSMPENNSHPLIVRWPNNIIEIPERLQSIDAIKHITNITRGRFSTQYYTLQEVWLLLGAWEPIDAHSIPSLDLIKTIQTRHTILLQLLAHKRWKILCLLDMVQKWWSTLETTDEWQTGIFHTGSRLPLGRIASQYLVYDDQEVEIPTLLEKQKQQPDIIAWRDRSF